MSTNITPFQQYLYVIGKLKDVYKLDVEVPHRDIHTFFQGKTPIFKLLFGEYIETGDSNIVISFHIDVTSVDIIQWFLNVQALHPLLKIADHYLEDDKGETYLGEDADAIKNLKKHQEVLAEWLDNKDEKEIKSFVSSKIVGRIKDQNKTFNSRIESDQATMEFNIMKKPGNGDSIH